MAYLVAVTACVSVAGRYLYGGGTAGKVVPVREVGSQH